MGKKIKKETKGPSSKFISRAKAIRKLQLPLMDFRKLCILKGVHPRDPKRKLGKTHLTYYHLKDIKYLEQDKTIDYFRSLSIYRKKLKRAKAKRDLTRIQALKQNKPLLDINHIIKERYCSFDEALKDLDDALSLVSLVARFPGHRLFKIDPQKVEINSKLILAFKTFVQQERLLEKVFLSVKGIYFQCRINGYPVIWTEPYPFAQTLPFDVDYKVVLSFLEFNQVFLKFVLFKLFKNRGLVFPPLFLAEPESSSNSPPSQYANCVLRSTGENEHADIMESEELRQMEGQNPVNKKLFNSLSFFVSREVNIELFEFLIKSFGGAVFHDLDNFESETFRNNEFTHILIDRTVQGCEKANTEYVQPQWICDCINSQILLPTQDYVPGSQLPPHLSPFVSQDKEGFVPKRLQEIMEFKGQYEEESVSEESEQERAEREEQPAKYSVQKQDYDHEKAERQKTRSQKVKEEEEKNLSSMTLSRKKKKLLDRIRNLDVERREEIKQLIRRKKQLAKNN